MTAPIEYRLVDEVTDLKIDDNYDPLLRDGFEDHIHITEKIRPGKRNSFNNIPDKETRDVTVTGLVLYWSKDIKKSKLRALLNRDNIETLTMCADTVIIDTTIQFPQANVTIYARRLIINKDGKIDTAPKPFANPYAQGGKPPDNMKRGADGGDAGDINLYVYSYKLPAEEAILFNLKGSDGQKGERGGLRDRKTSDKVPVSWEKLKDTVLSYDPIRGDESDWDFPDNLYLVEHNRVYHAKLFIYNVIKGHEDHIVELGDKSVDNQDNGLDAYASGDGGNGGRGGSLRFINTDLPRQRANLEGGAPGISEFIEGVHRYKPTTMYHMEYHFVHHEFAQDKVAYSKTAHTMTSRPGNDAKGKDGNKGGDGTIERLKGQDARWIHPFILETVLQFSRDTFLTGDRRPAKWLLDIYQAAFKKFEKDAVLQDALISSFRNEMDGLQRKLNDNLDYYGNPVGWVPRLSALTNIQILKNSSPAIARLLHYARQLELESQKVEQKEEHLEYMVEYLEAEIKKARTDLENAYGQLNGLKIELDGLDKNVSERKRKITELEQKIINELKDQAQEQAIFTGALQLAAGLCYVIPVGQPYVGTIGSSVLSNISKIDIHSDNPFGEAVKTTKGLAGDLSSFITNNKDKLTQDLNSSLSQEISSTQGEINGVDSSLGEYKGLLQEAEKELKKKFGSKLDMLQDSVRRLQSIRTKEELEFVASNEYGMILGDIELYKNDINKIEKLSKEDKSEIVSKLSELEREKGDLVKKLKEYNDKKDKRTKKIKKATEFLSNVSKGVSGLADGIQTMMTQPDEKSDEFRKKIEKAKTQKFKDEFKKLFEEIDDLNDRKLKATQKLLKLGQIIETSCQTLSNSLIQKAVFNDQRVEQAERQLSALTKLFVKRVIQDTRRLLLAEIYYLVKSYQYRFVKKVDGDIFNIQTIIDSIENFISTHGGTTSEEDYKKAFSFVLQSRFSQLVLDLLTNQFQNLPDLKRLHFTVTLTDKATLPDGRKLLQEFSERKRVPFRLHELGDIDSKGSGEEFYYRIENIIFKEMEVEFTEKTLKEDKDIADRTSISFSITHSGNSVIRAANGLYYYFTSRNPANSASVIQNVKSWKATYNGVDRNKADHGIVNETASATDRKILETLLAEIYKEKVPPLDYADHLPGATSELTLSIDKNNLKTDFQIKRLVFEFHYELVSGETLRMLAQKAATDA